MSEDTPKYESKERTPTRWATFSATPDIVKAVQYVVFEKDGKRFGNFGKILELPGINGQVSEQMDHIRVATKAGRVKLRASDWLVIDRVGSLSCYRDVDFHKLFEEGTPVDSSEPPKGADATALVEAKFSPRFTQLESDTSSILKEIEQMKIRIEQAFNIPKEMIGAPGKESKNVKSKTSKS